MLRTAKNVMDRTNFKLVVVDQGPVVLRVSNAIHGINCHPVNNVVVFGNACPRDSDLSGG